MYSHMGTQFDPLLGDYLQDHIIAIIKVFELSEYTYLFSQVRILYVQCMHTSEINLHT
jgi:hypothetical protein